MATSTKVQFKLDALKDAALFAVKTRIANAQEDVDYYDASRSDELMSQWRTEQEARVSHLFSRLGGKDLSNDELAQFKIATPPTDDTARGRMVAERRLRELRDIEGRITAKASSLVPDPDGNVSLTKTQLSEFFGL